MNGHYGRLVTMLYQSVGPMLNASVLTVEFRAPDGDLHTQDLVNDHWHVGNPSLQFMATQGYRPTDLDTRYDAEDDKNHFLIVPTPEQPDHEWLLSQDALREDALRNAEWFDANDDSDDEPPNQNPGGGSPDPGTGNRGGVDNEEDDVEIELAGEDSDSGVTVSVP